MKDKNVHIEQLDGLARKSICRNKNYYNDITHNNLI